MSIIDAFNTSEQIIDPSAVARPIEGFPDTVLVTFSQKVLEAAAKRFKLTLRMTRKRRVISENA